MTVGGLPELPFACVRHKSNIILVVASELQFRPVLAELCGFLRYQDAQKGHNGSLLCLLAKAPEHHLGAGPEPGAAGTDPCQHNTMPHPIQDNTSTRRPGRVVHLAVQP